MFRGGPSWPNTRQAYMVARWDHALLLAGDGLSDPFDDDGESTVNGLEHEFFTVTTDPIDPIDHCRASIHDPAGQRQASDVV